jgi:uncharacterized protein YndB with AHSA1/START domain
MKTKDLLVFSIDKENKKVKVERSFAASLPKVWEAWTKSNLLDQWWAPKPWKAETKTMDFREGGYWIYAMVGPEGEKHWGRTDFKSIQPYDGYTATDAFCDENGTIDESFPGSMWVSKFTEKDGYTTVSMDISFKEQADLEQMIEMGFKEGFTAGLQNLEDLLASR